MESEEAETTEMAQTPVGIVGYSNGNREVAAISCEWRTRRPYKECSWLYLLLGVLVVGIIISIIIGITACVVKPEASVQHCPDEWVGYRKKCYFVSEEEKNWTSAQTFCNNNESLLASFGNQEEMRSAFRVDYSRQEETFFTRRRLKKPFKLLDNNWDEGEFLYAHLKCRKRLYVPAYLDQAAYVEIDKQHSLVKRLKIDDSWIGLLKKGESFFWENGIALKADLFQIRNHSECAYLDGFTIFTSACSLPRRWICVKTP